MAIMDTTQSQDLSTAVDTSQNPADFSLSNLALLTTANPDGIDLTFIMVEFAYYEDIFQNTCSGYVAIKDSAGFIEQYRLCGDEYIRVTFSKSKDQSVGIDKQFRVYSAGKRTQANKNSEFYILYFCSDELFINEQYKVSKAYKGNTITEIVTDVVNNYLQVDSSNIDIIEDTTGTYDFIIPYMKPFEAINWLSTYAQQAEYNGADMLFFETADGYNFRSLQSLYNENIYGTFSFDPQNTGDQTTGSSGVPGDGLAAMAQSSIISLEIIDSYNTLKAITEGGYTNRMISVDPLLRNFYITDFDYVTYFDDSTTLNNYPVINNLADRLGNYQNQTAEGVLRVAVTNYNQKNANYISNTASKVMGVANDMDIETAVTNRISQISMANYTRLKVSIAGNATLRAGMLLQINIPSTYAGDSGVKGLDPYYSGDYIITAIKHTIDSSSKYSTLLELAKDSITQEYQSIDTTNNIWQDVVKGIF